MIRQFLREEDGATAIEYGLIASLIMLSIVASVRAFSEANNANWELIRQSVEGATGGNR